MVLLDAIGGCAHGNAVTFWIGFVARNIFPRIYAIGRKNRAGGCQSRAPMSSSDFLVWIFGCGSS